MRIIKWQLFQAYRAYIFCCWTEGVYCVERNAYRVEAALVLLTDRVYFTTTFEVSNKPRQVGRTCEKNYGVLKCARRCLNTRSDPKREFFVEHMSSESRAPLEASNALRNTLPSTYLEALLHTRVRREIEDRRMRTTREALTARKT
ncbi:hypothetical protein EVAR_35196_1 [Eumeta japonica]|uniref:Uncharacterized protein n=1 Tax=Eumeta variegata TaxID=151549 RepID=A0A4C1VDA3_EUMVA|nr:hypothetical protein EVAR_35196_1 [Eumeta japonica]